MSFLYKRNSFVSGTADICGEMSASGSTSYMAKLQRIDQEDLKYVEKDLRYYEKVSITFLLFGNQANAMYALQKLLTLYNSKEEPTEILYEYSRTCAGDEWKQPIVEALAIIKAYRVIRKLGLDKDEVCQIYLPHIPEIGVFIHPILKTLYKICEQLTPAETGKLLLEINKNSTLRFYDSEYLEVFLLDWITKGEIAIGDSLKKIPPDLDKLIEYFKLNDKIPLFDLILSSINEFNKILRIRNRNVNDSALTTFGTDLIKSKSFDKRESLDFSEVDMSYKIDFETAGYLLIINQMEFYRETDEKLKHLLPKKELATRTGSEVDEERLKETFITFGYKCVVKRNLSHHELICAISDFAARSIAFDSIIVSILSHGAEGTVYGSNSIPVEISVIKKLLTKISLLNKPKVLIVQACQGSELQEAVKINNEEETDAPGTTVATFSDMLVLMSTVPGYASIRHKIEGTWFIQSLCKHIRHFGDKKHIYDILTIVNQDVQSKRGSGNECMVPIFSSTLGKYLYLPKSR